jgi:CheY-like chemotaxis protein
VVDDSITARALHRTMLEAGGFTVHTASSGHQAQEQLSHAQYDVMVCDVAMEEMDGVELLAAVRSNPRTRGLPVILVSAHDTDDERARGLSAGADAFLSKKDRISGRLLAEVETVITRRKGTR